MLATVTQALKVEAPEAKTRPLGARGKRRVLWCNGVIDKLYDGRSNQRSRGGCAAISDFLCQMTCGNTQPARNAGNN